MQFVLPPAATARRHLVRGRRRRYPPFPPGPPTWTFIGARILCGAAWYPHWRDAEDVGAAQLWAAPLCRHCEDIARGIGPRARRWWRLYGPASYSGG